MKKFVPIVCLALLLVLTFAFAACESEKVPDVKLSFKVDGQVVSTISTDGKSALVIPNDPSKEGYTFDGWYWDENVWKNPVTAESLKDVELSEDMSLYAKFSPIAYTVTFVADGGTHSNSSTYTIETTLSLQDAEKSGYTFDGWFFSLEDTQKVTSITKGTTGDKTLYAKYSLIDYAITYQNVKDAANANPTSFNAESEEIRLSPIAKDDLIFEGWTDESGATVTVLSPSEHKNRVLTASWTCVNHVPGRDCKCTVCGKTVHTPGRDCVCTVCGASVHTVNADCVCTVCGKTVHGVKEGAYCKHGDCVYFGSYPQTEVKDGAITTALNAAAGALPTAENAGKWTDYGYYRGNDDHEPVQQSYMWYIDLVKDGVKYRGVYFSEYRLGFTGKKYMNDYDSYQDDNGYEKGNVYWFAFEPIRWRVLTTEEGVATLLCESVIDVQNVYLKGENLGYITTLDNGQKIYQNNYEYSTIRDWLNETFYNAAFDALQKEAIQLTTVDNSPESGNPNNDEDLWDTSRRPCADTRDYVYLPSEKEVTTEDYGFNASYSYEDPARQKGPTDYAKAQGCYYECSWWLRSPQWSTTYTMKIVSMDGKAYRDRSVDDTSTGVAPVVRIQL